MSFKNCVFYTEACSRVREHTPHWRDGNAPFAPGIVTVEVSNICHTLVVLCHFLSDARNLLNYCIILRDFINHAWK